MRSNKGSVGPISEERGVRGLNTLPEIDKMMDGVIRRVTPDRSVPARDAASRALAALGIRRNEVATHEAATQENVRLVVAVDAAGVAALQLANVQPPVPQV